MGIVPFVGFVPSTIRPAARVEDKMRDTKADTMRPPSVIITLLGERIGPNQRTWTWSGANGKRRLTSATSCLFYPTVRRLPETIAFHQSLTEGNLVAETQPVARLHSNAHQGTIERPALLQTRDLVMVKLSITPCFGSSHIQRGASSILGWSGWSFQSLLCTGQQENSCFLTGIFRVVFTFTTRLPGPRHHRLPFSYHKYK